MRKLAVLALFFISLVLVLSVAGCQGEGQEAPVEEASPVPAESDPGR